MTTSNRSTLTGAVALVAGVTVMVGASPVAAQKGKSTAGTAVLVSEGMSIGPDSGGAYPGSFDRSGNFSFNLVGTTREVCFTFGEALPLLTAPRIDNVPPPTDGCRPAAFTVLASATADGILDIAVGTAEVRSVRFNFPNDANSEPTSYAVGFRGDAELDGLPEMSRVKVTCEAGTAGGCTTWLLEPCASAVDGPCGVSDAAVVETAEGYMEAGLPVGQITAGLPKGKGNTTVSRHVLPWRMRIMRQ